jgi:dipeptidyl aminopeptidase/acylaminoacyl peptidase
MPRVGKPVPSPDGKWVVFQLTEPAYDEKKEVSDLWIVPADGSAKPRRLTAAKGSESDVAWSNDSSRIAFSAKRGDDEVTQIYVLNVTSAGEAERITNLPLAARSPRWSPDGRSLLFLSSSYPNSADEEANRTAAKAKKDEKSNVRVFENFPIRRWDKWLDETQSHLFVVDVNEDHSVAKSRDLLAGSKLIASGFSGRSGEGSKDELDPLWSPDGKSIVFVALDQANASAYASVASHLYRVEVKGGEPVRLTSDDRSYSRPRFTPDGKHLCSIVSDDKEKIYALERIGCNAWPWSDATNIVTATFDRSVNSWAFTPDGKTIYLTAEDRGHERIFSVPSTGGETKLAVDAPEGVFTSLEISERAAKPMLFASWGSAISPAEIVRIDPATKKRSNLTSFNVARAASLDWSPLQEFWFTNSAGQQIHNVFVTPAGFDPTKKYPLFALIHGGAANMWRDQITLRWNYHLIAKPGYVLVLTDYTGSTGYGEKFTQALLGEPLRRPGLDLNEAVDEAVKRYSFVDGTRLAAGGASYGGHLANWLEATTTRYKCLVSHAGLANLEAQWGTSDGIYHRELTAQGPVWEQNAVWREQNPVRYAKNFKRPMLLSVGENDYRVPMNNTLEMWSYLQRMRVPSRLLVWPEENHWITKGENSKRFYEELHNWLARWL